MVDGIAAPLALRSVSRLRWRSVGNASLSRPTLPGTLVGGGSVVLVVGSYQCTTWTGELRMAFVTRPATFRHCYTAHPVHSYSEFTVSAIIF